MNKDFFKGMQKGDKAAILMVHFGTTYDETRTLTIDKINQKVEKEFKGIIVKEAYTSRIIMRKLKERGVVKLNPKEALDELKAQGYTHVLVQSTNIMNGIESENLKKEVASYEKFFKDIRLGAPLLTEVTDYEKVAEAIVKKVGVLKENQGVVLVGHGTKHFAASAYSMMDYVFSAKGYDNYAVGTIEGYPEFDNVVKKLSARGIREVILIPFMFVAGDHAQNDIAGDWNKDLQEAGFKISKIVMMGLGENEDIQDIYLEHIKFISKHRPEDIAAKKIEYSRAKNE